MVQYKWILQYSTQTHEAFPIWKDDLTLDYTFEQNQQFRRTALSTNITFVGDDYTWIMNRPFGVKILLTIKAQWAHGAAYEDYWHGAFYITDCTINRDDKSIVVKPSVEDRYTKILAGLDKEFDLIKLKTAQHYVNMKRRPMLQIYQPGDSFVTCLCGGSCFDVEITNDGVSVGDLTNIFHFAQIGYFIQISIDNAPVGMDNAFFGNWNHGNEEGTWKDFVSFTGANYMTYQQRWVAGVMTTALRIYDTATDTLLCWSYNIGKPVSPFSFTYYEEQLTARWSESNIYARWLVASNAGGMYRVGSDDIVPYNRNYKWCIPFQGESPIVTSANSSEQPTSWGLRPDGRYYEKPTLTPEQTQFVLGQYPVSRSAWQTWSVWIQWTDVLEGYDFQYTVPKELRDAYPLEDVLTALLKEIDSSISFAADADHSEFLYSTNNPITDFFTGRIVITPKSNILVAEYTQPAQKAPTTLKEVLTMLKNVCGCHWFIDDSNRLRIEHISWFKKGGTYASGDALVVGCDLTAIQNTRNGKRWSFDTDTYSYDRIDMPERYQYEWADSTTDAFKGNPIEVLSGYVQQGKIEEINIGGFNSDIDYIMLNPTDVSEDGFALIFCTVYGDTWSTSLRHTTVGDNIVNIQNWQLAMANLQSWFLTYDMPSWNIKVNGTAVTAKGIQRMKKQTVSVPYTEAGDIDMQKLVKTTVGNGEVERASVRLTSRTTKLTLRYDTTQQ